MMNGLNHGWGMSWGWGWMLGLAVLVIIVWFVVRVVNRNHYPK